ncbi:hypothetical protein A6A04_18380 [Paramagnetospirillum marisnigri]|uniref:Uncharacterized protein n=2 Tax=Paramagnetospirillum marisnigri TaxID=1285242 RepID=A0A178MP16_9PROT|nr:hypothetical protein A6A04_18380 [Paramagnetospirillum marisnigri]
MRKIFAIGTAGFFAVALMSYWIWKTQYDERRVIDPAPLSKHMENFVAKYRREECLARLDFMSSGSWSEDMNQRIFRSLTRFVAEEQPQMGLFWWALNPATGQMFVQFADDCPNRFEHMRDWARRYARRYDVPRFTVSTDIITPGPDTLDHRDDLWID